MTYVILQRGPWLEQPFSRAFCRAVAALLRRLSRHASLGFGLIVSALTTQVLSRVIPRSTRNTAATTITADTITFNEIDSLANHQPSRTATMGFT